MFRLVKGLKNESKEVEGGRCMRGSDENLCFSEKKTGKVWKDFIIYEENNWYHNMEGGPVVCVSREEAYRH